MKNLIFILTLFSLIQCGLNAQPASDKAFLKKVNLVQTKVPSVFMFKYEVSNIGYREMMAFAKQKDTALYRFLLPDTAVWLTPSSNQEAFFNYYFRHPAFSSYPVVGVSYEQANAYCQLLTDFFNSQLLPENKWLKKVLIRLPTEKEWEDAARGDHPNANYPWGHDGIRDPKNYNFLGNFLYKTNDSYGIAGQLNDGLDLLMPNEAFAPNSLGLYHMAGNIAEMVQEEGISKGGCYRFGSLNARIDSVINYSKTEDWLGFRYVMEVEEYRNPVAKTASQDLDVKVIEKLLNPILDTTRHHLRRDLEPCASYQLYSGPLSSFQCQPFYISKEETSNELYALFLGDLRQTKPDLASLHAPIDDLWAVETPLLNYLHYSNQEHFQQYPVVNISNASAEAFCAWLTEKYNANTKRKFNKVAFSLPTEAEWVLAASKASDPIGKYIEPMVIAPPDGTTFQYNYCPNDERFFSMNEDKNGMINGTYLFPDNDSTHSRGLDGYVYTAPVNAYSSKKAPLTNLFGNASEMLSDQTFTKGGSWASLEENLQIATGECEQGPAPSIGFRFVMHVLE
jgi:formylglycine-generating enzyme required for sulfatase activity